MAAVLRKAREGAIYSWLLVCALISVATTAAIIALLTYESVNFFRAVSPFEFLFGTTWTPQFHPPHYGVLPLVAGTFLISAGALLIAVPLGLATAIYLSEYAPAALRQIAKPLLEVLAGVPTVVYGFFAVTFISKKVLLPMFPDVRVFNAASAAIVMAVMILPTIASLCDDAIRAVPRTLREAGYALSATKLEVSTRIVFPAALSGVIAAVLLALGRAIGETMIVLIAAGATPKLTLNPLESVQTLTAYIAQISKGDTPPFSFEYKTIFAVGVLLFAITLAINVIANHVLRRYREVYE
jgi:phosphate transport system permease protein